MKFKLIKLPHPSPDENAYYLYWGGACLIKTFATAQEAHDFFADNYAPVHPGEKLEMDIK